MRSGDLPNGLGPGGSSALREVVDMSDEENEPGGDEVASEDTTVEGTSIFDAFEPPPDVDPNRFGPVPIIGEDPETSTIEIAGDELTIDDLVIIDSDEELPPREGTIELHELLGDPDILDDTDLLGDREHLASEFDSGDLAGDGPTASDLDEPAPTSASSSDLPHWTEPPTGQVPSVVASERGDDDSWQDLGGPRWKGEGPDWAEDDIADVLGAPAGEDDDGIVVIEDGSNDLDGLLPPGGGAPQRAVTLERPRPTTQEAEPGERNIPVAIGVGIAMAAVALAAFRLSGNLWALGLITVVAVLAAVELFDAMRRAGLHPATLLGLTAVASFPLAVYSRGDAAVPLMLGLTVVFGALWYIVGADTHRPALNLGLSFLGIAWIGGLASFAALILLLPDGKSMLVAAIIITVASDTFALAGGKAFGSRPFHSASPNKTWEGTLVGFVAAVGAGAVVGLLDISFFSVDFTHAIYLGIVGGILAPIGDLTESMIKRDLGVKDMGQLLPGHGGILDRVDGLLFVLPGVYYLALVLGLT